MVIKLQHLTSFILLCIILIHSTDAAPIGLCYGRVANNLPPPADVINLIKSNGISRIRLFNADPEALSPLSGTGIELVIGIPNENLTSLASGDVNYALEYLQSNIVNHIPPNQIRYLAVGNEILLKDPFYTPQILPAINNLYQALQILGLSETIKLSSSHAASILSNSYPPSAGEFDPNNLVYDNLFDETVDAFIYAMEREGFMGIPVVVTETGWPTAGLENARAYNGNVVRSGVNNIGTPKRPGVGVEAELFDENEKSGRNLRGILDIMGNGKMTRRSFDFQKNDRKEHPRVTLEALCTFMVRLPEGLNNKLKINLKRFSKNKHERTSAFSMRKHKESSSAVEVSLEKQLQAWKENPTWTDQPPDIKVTVPKGSLSHLSVKVNVGFPPDAVYNIVIDPDNKRVFKNIKEVISRKVLVDEGTRQVVDLEQAAVWKFLWWSGTIPVHVLVDQNREDHSMKFTQVKTDYMKRFEGLWKVEPVLLDENLCHPFKPNTVKDYMTCTKGKGRIGSIVSLEQIIEPAVIPPPPISWYLRGITIRTTEMLINDLLEETARIRGVGIAENTIEQKICEEIFENKVDELCDIKERWALQRRNARQRQRRVPLNLRSHT